MRHSFLAARCAAGSQLLSRLSSPWRGRSCRRRPADRSVAAAERRALADRRARAQGHAGHPRPRASQPFADHAPAHAARSRRAFRQGDRDAGRRHPGDERGFRCAARAVACADRRDRHRRGGRGGRNKAVSPIDGLVRIDEALARYPAEFDHPGWVPLRSLEGNPSSRASEAISRVRSGIQRKRAEGSLVTTGSVATLALDPGAAIASLSGRDDGE